MQTQQITHDAVSFKGEAHEVLQQAADQKSPIKLTGFKRKANFRDNSLQDIEINKCTAVTMLENVPFKYSTAAVPLAPFVTLKSIQEKGYDKQLVSILVYVNVGGCFNFQRIFKIKGNSL